MFPKGPKLFPKVSILYDFFHLCLTNLSLFSCPLEEVESSQVSALTFENRKSIAMLQQNSLVHFKRILGVDYFGRKAPS